jgi:hypothetical protein
MADLKTKENDASVQDYLNAIDDPQRKDDCLSIHEIMQRITGHEGSMWGNSMIGYGSYHYKYESGREGDWFLAGFANRKKSISIYIMSGFSQYDDLLDNLGKHKTGKFCLYINKLDDIDKEILEKMIETSVEYIQHKYREE